ncbi:MAG: zinc ribbon domain-containing protein [Nitrospinota bacterium]|nr:MAG: zinc ribbon domain-containing protein [Nitrospinota bacterium]
MPIYEYRCLRCEHEFEKLVFNSSTPVVCTACGADQVIRKPSLFASKSGSRFVSSVGGGCSTCGGGSCASCASY